MKSDNYEMYKAVEGRYHQLMHEGKEKTRAGIGFSSEMDYWWKRLTREERLELITTAKQELEEAFSKKFSENFPNTQL